MVKGIVKNVINVSKGASFLNKMGRSMDVLSRALSILKELEPIWEGGKIDIIEDVKTDKK